MTKKSYTRSKAQPMGLTAGLIQADSLYDRGRLLEARNLLEELDRRYPRKSDVLYDLVNIYYDLKDIESYRSAIERLAQIVDDDPDVAMGLAGAYLSNLQLTMALGAFRRFVARWPDHPRAREASKTIKELESALKDQLDRLGLSGDEGIEIAGLNEQTLSYIERGEFERARKVVEQLLKRKPDFVPGLNNASLIYSMEGQLERAIGVAEQALQIDPDNVHALSNMVRFLCVSGRVDDAKEWAERLKAAHSEATDVWVKKAEGLSYLGDDTGVLEALNGAEHDPSLKGVPKQPFLYHMAAVAAVRLGKEKEAQRYWRQALKEAPTFNMALSNLQDLANPVGERHAPWPFSFVYWLSPRTMADLRATASQSSRGKGNNKAAERELRRFLQKHPEVLLLVPALLDRGDPAAREFALRFASLLRTPEMLQALHDFALSNRGPDNVRMDAIRIVQKAGLLPQGTARMWMQGEWHEIMLYNFDIHDEPSEEYPENVENAMVQALEALHEGDGAEAERVIKQIQEAEPGAADMPSVMNNLAAAYEMQGRREEARALISRIYEQHPDYPFARISLAKLSILEGDTERAKELLDPMLARGRLHHLEFAALCEAQIQLHMAMKDREAARSWLDMWAGVDPDDPGVERWQRRLGTSTGNGPPRRKGR